MPVEEGARAAPGKNRRLGWLHQPSALATLSVAFGAGLMEPTQPTLSVAFVAGLMEPTQPTLTVIRAVIAAIRSIQGIKRRGRPCKPSAGQPPCRRRCAALRRRVRGRRQR